MLHGTPGRGRSTSQKRCLKRCRGLRERPALGGTWGLLGHFLAVLGLGARWPRDRSSESRNLTEGTARPCRASASELPRLPKWSWQSCWQKRMRPCKAEAMCKTVLSSPSLSELCLDFEVRLNARRESAQLASPCHRLSYMPTCCSLRAGRGGTGREGKFLVQGRRARAKDGEREKPRV